MCNEELGIGNEEGSEGREGEVNIRLERANRGIGQGGRGNSMWVDVDSDEGGAVAWVGEEGGMRNGGEIGQRKPNMY